LTIILKSIAIFLATQGLFAKARNHVEEGY
jgi:hypothetical protein